MLKKQYHREKYQTDSKQKPIFNRDSWTHMLTSRSILSYSICAQSLQSCLTLCNLWAVACQAPLSMGFSRQEYWSELLHPPPGYFPDPEIKPISLASAALQAGYLPPSHLRSPQESIQCTKHSFHKLFLAFQYRLRDRSLL